VPPKEAQPSSVWYLSNTMWPGPRPTSIPSGILIHPAAIQYIGQNCGCGSGVPTEHNVAWAEVYLHTNGILIHPAVWDGHRPKIGAVPFGDGSWAPCNAVWPGPRPTSMPSFILIHPIVWPQSTNVTDRQTDRQTDRTDNGLIAQGKPFYKR